MTDISSSAEWQLIALTPESSSSSSSSSSLIRGELSPAFHTPTAQRILAQHASSSSSSSSSLPTSLQWDPSSSAFDAIHLAAAALAAFIQLNWTGPSIPDDIRLPTLLRWCHPSAFPPRSVQDSDHHDAAADSTLEDRLNIQALDSLTRDGEPAYHLCEQPFYLLLAIQVLQTLSSSLAIQQQPESLPWWRLRAASVQNRILDTAVALPRSIIVPVDSLLAKLGHRAAAAAAVVDSSDHQKLSPSPASLHTRLLLERGLALSHVGQDKEANEFFIRAAQSSGLKYELTGALGKKTKFQKDEKTILVVLAESAEGAEGEAEDHQRENGEADVKGEHQEQGEEEDDDEVPPLSSSGWKSAPAVGQRADLPADYQLNDDTLLEHTRFTSNNASGSISHRDPSKQPPLTPLDQAILLALSLAIRNSSPEHGLTTSQIAAFVARVAQHPRNWSVFTMALLLRSRLEATRTRTAERAVLQLQALLDQMPTTDSTAQERLRYFYQLDLPPKWEMQAELARRYASLGVLRSALEIFEKIEMWEEVVQMMGMMGRQEEGVEILKDLLSGKKVEASQAIANRKSTNTTGSSNGGVVMATSRLNAARQAKLWCLLGDLQPEQAEEHYKKAWEVSGRRSARAARSLGGLYFSHPTSPDYGLVISWLHRALKLSSLMSRSWFMLGCAYMRREEWGKAARSFRRVTAIEDEDGEAWNNLASCYLRMVSGATVEDIEADDPEMEEQRALRDGEGLDMDDGEQGSGNESDRTFRTDSGVELTSSSEDDDDEGITQTEIGNVNGGEGSTSSRREVLSPFVLKTLAHRCLRHALRHSPDSWKVWSNYMIVSVDIGEMNEACRALGKVVQLKARSLNSRSSSSSGGGGSGGSGRLGEEDVDWQVLDRLVDAVIRSPSQTGEEMMEEEKNKKKKREEGMDAVSNTMTPPVEGGYEASTAGAISVPIPATSETSTSILPQASTPAQAPAATPAAAAPSQNEGRGLYASVQTLLSTILLPSITHPRLHRNQARLYIWSHQYGPALQELLSAYHLSPISNPSLHPEVLLDLSLFLQGVRDLHDVIQEILTLSASMQDEKMGKFKARSLLRSFLTRYREAWETREEYAEMQRFLDEEL